MTAQIRYGTPYVAGIQWILNKIIENVPVTDRYGNQGEVGVSKDPNIKFVIISYDGDEALGSDPYPIEGEEYAAFAPAIDEVKAAWEAAFNELREAFTITKTQPAGASKKGTPFYMRLDRWMVNFTPGQMNSVEAIIGVYSDEACTDVRSYKAVTAIDGKTQRQRASNRTQLVTSIKNLQDIIDGTNKLFDRLEADRPAIIASATAELPARQKALVDHDKQEQSLTSLLSMLAMPTVQQSVGQLCATLFTYLKQTKPKWAGIDVAELMAPENFKIPDVA